MPRVACRASRRESGWRRAPARRVIARRQVARRRPSRYSGHGVATTSADAPSRASSGAVGQRHVEPPRSAGSARHRRIVGAHRSRPARAASGTARPRSIAAACRCRACRSGPRPPTVRAGHVRRATATAGCCAQCRCASLLDLTDDSRCVATPCAWPSCDRNDHVARQRAAGERAARRQVGVRPDARFRLQPALDFRRVGADLLAERRDLVDERHRRRQERVERVLGHLRRFDRHPFDPVGERPKQRRRPCRGRAGDRTPATTRSGCVKTSIALPRRRFSGEQAKPTDRPSDVAGEQLLEPPRRADRQLRRDQHQRAVPQVRKQPPTSARRRTRRRRDRPRRPACRR